MSKDKVPGWPWSDEQCEELACLYRLYKNALEEIRAEAFVADRASPISQIAELYEIADRALSEEEEGE